MNRSSCDCVCAGIVVADHVCAPIERLPRSGELILTPRMELTIGGCASNVAVDLAKLDRSVNLVGVVGDDVFGRFVRETLTESGVSCEHLRVASGHSTSGTFVINARGEDRRFIHCIGANGAFTGAELTPDLARSGRVLYLGGYCLCEALKPELVKSVFQAARQAGVLTVLDVVVAEAEAAWRQLEPVLSATDVFLPNTDEARAITGLSDPLAQAETFQAAGAKTVVITCGGDGAILLSPTQRLRAGAYAVDYLDGTGSGDAFSAGFIHGLLADADLKTCLQWGSALGASCVQAAGATTGTLTAPALTAFCQANPLEIQSRL